MIKRKFWMTLVRELHFKEVNQMMRIKDGYFLEEIHNESLEGTSYNDIESTKQNLLQNEQHDKYHDLLSDLSL